MDTFTTIERAGAKGIVHGENTEAIAAALFEGEGCAPWRGGGRAEVLRFPCGDGHGVLRRHRRGGLAARLLPRGLFLTNRPGREFEAHRALQAAGVPVPRLLGAAWRRRGVFFSGAIATEAVDAPTLQECLEEAATVEHTLARIGGLVRRMHDAGGLHADLQIRNILVTPSGPLLLDFDKARAGRAPGRVARARNLFRLRRSLEKNGFIDPQWFEWVLRGYGGAPPPAWLGALYRLKGRCSDLLSRRQRHA